jgi:hypothetical protein
VWKTTLTVLNIALAPARPEQALQAALSSPSQPRYRPLE